MRTSVPRLIAESLFFAVMLERGAQEQTAGLIERLRAEHGWRGREVASERRHITLAWLDHHEDLPCQLVEAARRTAAKVSFRPFDVGFNRVAGSTSLVLLGSEELDQLRLFQAMLRSEMRNGPLRQYARWPFRPHVTLLYDHCRVASRPVEPVRWTVRDFALIHSRVGLTQHRLLDHWSLEESAPTLPLAPAAAGVQAFCPAGCGGSNLGSGLRRDERIEDGEGSPRLALGLK